MKQVTLLSTTQFRCAKSGELDAQIEAASAAVRERFKH